MFDNSQSVKIEMNVPANGVIQKSTDKSFFITFHCKSNYANQIFCANPIMHNSHTSKSENIIVLQTLLMSEGMVLCEVILKKDVLNKEGEIK